MRSEESPLRWKANGLPRKGWRLIDVVDLGGMERSHCQWCGTEIRFVHELRHEGVETHTLAGCVCAVLLTGDYEGPTRQETALRAYAAQRLKWLGSPRWRMSAKNNWYRRDRGGVLIFWHMGYWKLQVRKEWGTRRYQTIEGAKLHALRWLIELDTRG